MTIQISGTTVIDQSRNITNVVGYYGPGIASQAEAQSGTDNTQLMTPLRVKQSVLSNGLTTVIKRIQRGTTSVTSPSQTVPWQGGGGSPTPAGTTNVSITSVNTGKSFLTKAATGRSGKIQSTAPAGQSSAGYGWGFDGVNASATLSSATNVAAKTGTGLYGVSGSPFNDNYAAFTVSCSVDWEVVEFN